MKFLNFFLFLWSFLTSWIQIYWTTVTEPGSNPDPKHWLRHLLHRHLLFSFLIVHCPGRKIAGPRYEVVTARQQSDARCGETVLVSNQTRCILTRVTLTFFIFFLFYFYFFVLCTLLCKSSVNSATSHNYIKFCPLPSLYVIIMSFLWSLERPPTSLPGCLTGSSCASNQYILRTVWLTASPVCGSVTSTCNKTNRYLIWSNSCICWNKCSGFFSLTFLYVFCTVPTGTYVCSLL